MNTELYTLLDYAFGQAGFTVTGEMHSGLLVSHRSTRYAVPKLKKTECSKRYFAQDGSYSQEYTFTASVTCFGAVCGYSDGQTMLTAIRTALDMAQPRDTVLIMGKGHEPYQEVRGVRHHFDDREEVRAYFGKA